MSVVVFARENPGVVAFCVGIVVMGVIGAVDSCSKQAIGKACVESGGEWIRNDCVRNVDKQEKACVENGGQWVAGHCTK